MTSEAFDFGEDKLPAPPSFPDLDVVTEGTAEAWAVFSTDRRYRYLLGRCWDVLRPVMTFGMLNPSVAGAFAEDPTLRKCIGFARRHHCGGLLVCNAAAFITPDTAELGRVEDPIGPYNHRMIVWACSSLFRIGVAAWGRFPSKRLRGRMQSSTTAMRHYGLEWCFGKTKDGEPRHPLMLPYSTPLVSLADGRPYP